MSDFHSHQPIFLSTARSPLWCSLALTAIRSVWSDLYLRIDTIFLKALCATYFMILGLVGSEIAQLQSLHPPVC